jgi:hypothetical protein
VIDNFAPQPYPLEVSTAEGIWFLVIGWRRDKAGNLVPLADTPDGLIDLADSFDRPLHYRQAAPPTSTLRVSPTATTPPPVARPARRPSPA